MSFEYAQYFGVTPHFGESRYVVIGGERPRVAWLALLGTGAPGAWPFFVVLLSEPLDAEPMDSLVARLRRSEERLRTRQGSASRFRGVSFGREGWKAQIKVNGRLLHLGHFKTQQHAAAAYEQAARSLHGVAPAEHGYVSSLAAMANPQAEAPPLQPAGSWEEQAQTASSTTEP